MSACLDAMDAAPFTGLASAGRPPRILAALGPKMLAAAAEKADSLLFDSLLFDSLLSDSLLSDSLLSDSAAQVEQPD